MTDDKLKNLRLIEIEKILNSNARSLRDYQSMSYPEMSDSRGKIVLNAASNEIASLLLPGGRTAHSRFSIPITITDESTCNIKHGSLKAELLIQITDQHKTHQPFGGKVVVLGGDFRQILLVIPKGSGHDILTSAINSSHLWSFCKVLKLYTNMRLLISSSDQDEGEMKRFANWILDVENGNIDSVVGDESEIKILNDLLITTIDDLFSHLVDFAYPNLL
ncbi:uncharacterized protein LOC107621385 [Arachis ipaensis]|uniref:uncharacterized protein LOC107621385 n=1 Tax=Arachis ipaensis TaxID=130454 RepID=UPI0007AF67F4|nr:uncharacterized protein LOC107621385 [Arachis ipaensis]